MSKPSNPRRQAENEAKATTRMQTGAFLTATGTTVGTPTYMAPEQAMAQDIGPWTDLYSVGCMAFELFTGNVPFHDSDAPMAILLRHVNEPIAPVKSIRPEVDQRISDWIERLLVKEPEERTQNAQDAWDDFEEILISLLGPRWRREARLVERRTEDTNGGGAKPLQPKTTLVLDLKGQLVEQSSVNARDALVTNLRGGEVHKMIQLRDVLAKATRVAVVDRAAAFGSFAPLGSDVRSLRLGHVEAVVDFVCGVGGTDVTPATLRWVVDETRSGRRACEDAPVHVPEEVER